MPPFRWCPKKRVDGIGQSDSEEELKEQTHNEHPASWSTFCVPATLLGEVRKAYNPAVAQKVFGVLPQVYGQEMVGDVAYS